MAAPNVQWVVSTKGKDQLTVNGYIFQSSGKCATPGPNGGHIRYWACATRVCRVRATTEANALQDVRGTVNNDHGHANNIQQIADVRLKVSFLLSIAPGVGS